MKNCLIAFIAAALAWSAPALAQEPAPGGGAPHVVWEPAPTPEGATSWELFQSTREIEEERDDGLYILPGYPDALVALDGETVRVNGYMMPLQNAERQTYFVLMAFPPDCPFCMTAGPANLIEVRAEPGIAHSYEAMVIEGRLELLYEDESGLFFRLADARRIDD